MEKTEVLLSDFIPVYLDDLKDVSLMNRMDLKYLFSVGQLPMLLKDLKQHYKVLEVNESRCQQYETIYYDTEDLEMYHMHHRGELERHKIRFRKYRSSDTVFLEVKVKDNRGVTEKNRVECMNTDRVILSEEEEFLSTHTPFNQEKLIPVIQNSFRRITLANLGDRERITIDFDLSLQYLLKDGTMALPGIAIAEIKREGVVYNSRMSDAMKKYRIHPIRFSKYCIGVAKLDTDVVSNRFKSIIRKIDHIVSDNRNLINNTKTKINGNNTV